MTAVMPKVAFSSAREEDESNYLTITQYGKCIRLSSLAYLILSLRKKEKSENEIILKISQETGCDLNESRDLFSETLSLLQIAGFFVE